ncbi:MAG: hypothetical protein ACRD97_11935 [Nitrososphaeraceae archaeon]
MLTGREKEGFEKFSNQQQQEDFHGQSEEDKKNEKKISKSENKRKICI